MVTTGRIGLQLTERTSVAGKDGSTINDTPLLPTSDLER